ncbi:ABC transporter permease [Solirubrobacter phytolaccae]|uniref:ABC transporter permease n=1 Tax=Solirubrobacter phytolaccae TaxID=1404360 RepID=A0A9X3NCX3_9ACTN|nr:ABC transporter permease [Solirubrobacter phytolaccae]MDA0184360.1 ABC transporter permease [Solirubrobacter phytolaccae]
MSAAAVAHAPRGDRATSLGLRALQAGPVLILAVLVVVMALLSPYFLTSRNVANVGFQASFVAVLALGQLLVIITRGIDLSVGSAVGLAGVVAAAWAGTSGAGSLALFLAAGLAVGTVNAVVLVYGRVPNPFIVTLGTLGIARGLALVLADGQTRTGLPPVVSTLGSGKVAGVPIPVLIVAALALTLGVLLGRTQWGRWIYAVGGHPEAARRAGIPANGVLVSVYVLCGLLAGVAAILVAGRTDSASPQAGQLLELDAITAVIIGGASFQGGRGRVVNVLAGALIIGVIRNGLDLLGVSPFWQLIAVGVLVIVSLELDVLRGHLEQRLRTRAASA